MSIRKYIQIVEDAQNPLSNPNFKAWFGKSKVVDAQGHPLVLFHGTKSDFGQFDIKKFGTSDEGLLGKGFYFTYNPSEASSYAENDLYGKGDSPNVMPVFVSLQNPFVIKRGILPDGRNVRDLHKGIGINSKGGKAVRDVAEAGGHDGIIWADESGKVLHVVAWSPNQIKSATGNKGTYNPDNHEINEAADAQQFGTITSGPELYLHHAHTEEQVRSIVTNGFDLKKFGFTAKKFKMQNMMANDPRGVFATDAVDGPDHRPHVIFKLEGTPRVLTRPDPKYPGMSANLKGELAQAYGCTGSKLANILLKQGIDVVHSQSEYIILNPKLIRIVKSSLD